MGMTTKEAIEAIKCNWPDSRYTILREALDMAISALREQEHFREVTKKVEPLVRCRECKHLNVVNRKELYAHCPKTNTVFLPFELDTREHFCSLGERKEGTV